MLPVERIVVGNGKGNCAMSNKMRKNAFVNNVMPAEISIENYNKLYKTKQSQ
jgi:hypothetical protein